MSILDFFKRKREGKAVNSTNESKGYQAIFDWLEMNPLEIGSLNEIKMGQNDFSKWGDGVIAGSKDWIINKLCSKLKEINAGNPDLEKAKNYSWQKSNLENICVRIQTLLPGGILAGHYIGRIGEDQYALFGYGFNYNEGLPLDHDESLTDEKHMNEIKFDHEEGKPLNYMQLFWYGFNKIVINSSSQDEIISLLGPGETSDWLKVTGEPIGKDYQILSYDDLGIAFYLENLILKEIELNQSWKGKTEGGFHIGSLASEIEELMSRLNNEKSIGAVNAPEGWNKIIAISLMRTVETPRGQKFQTSIAFYLKTPIEHHGIPQPPFPEIPIIKIQLTL